MTTRIGVIGGSGLYEIEGLTDIREYRIETPFGDPSDTYVVGRLDGVELVFLPRHGRGHRLNPSEVNYRANIYGMKKLGVGWIVSISAVGSLREDIAPGHMVIIDQFIDRTKSQRAVTFYEQGIVAHIAFGDPVCGALRGYLVKAAQAFQDNPAVGAIVLTGSEKAFAAGADIKQMQPLTYVDAYQMNLFGNADLLLRIRKSIIAAVSGYALGGGCELAMMCDFIIAADNAKFGQPEITLGVMPGMGGSQRLTRFVGKSKSMDMCLTGRMMDAAEAERSGLVSRVVPAHDLIEEAMKAASKIADFSLPAVMMTKEAVNRSYETTMAEGLRFERRLFHSMFALEDQKEGMSAFVEKRTANFRNR